MARQSLVKFRVTKDKLVIELTLQSLLACVESMNRDFRRDTVVTEELLPQYTVLNGPVFLKFLLREMRAGRVGSGEKLEHSFEYSLQGALSSRVAQERGWVLKSECAIPSSGRRAKRV